MSGCFATNGATRSKVTGITDEILRAYAAGETTTQIAARLPVSRETIRKVIVKAGMGSASRRARDIEFLAHVMPLLAAGRSREEIGAALGISANAVSERIRRACRRLGGRQTKSTDLTSNSPSCAACPSPSECQK